MLISLCWDKPGSDAIGFVPFIQIVVPNVYVHLLESVSSIQLPGTCVEVFLTSIMQYHNAVRISNMETSLFDITSKIHTNLLHFWVTSKRRKLHIEKFVLFNALQCFMHFKAYELDSNLSDE